MIINFEDRVFIKRVGIIMMQENGQINDIPEMIVEGKILIENNSYFVELIEDSPFINGRGNLFSYKALIQDRNGRDKFELMVLPNPEKYQFEIVEGRDYQLWLMDLFKNKLEKEIPKKIEKPRQKSKV